MNLCRAVILLLHAPLIAVSFVPSLKIVNTNRRKVSRNNLSLFSPIHTDIPKTTSEHTFVTSYNTGQWRSESVQSQDLLHGIREWLIPSANAADSSTPPTADEVKLLREAFEVLYGERNPAKAEGLLSKAITAWESQPPDERAGLYRVRGDCYTGMLQPENAVTDYGTALSLLSGPGGKLADPAEIPAARLGRARAQLGMGQITKEQYTQAAEDYQIALRLTSREDWDTDAENEEDGAARNPYAAWEWGIARRGAGDYQGAAESHKIASRAFKDIGDRPRAVIAALDAGIDLAASDDIDSARTTLTKAIDSTTSAEANDVELLQRVIAKEGEARIALASILWAKDKSAAEDQLYQACTRLDQLQADADARRALRVKKGLAPDPPIPKRLSYTIDDIVGPEASCTRYKNQEFLSKTLAWPEALQTKVSKLNKLGN